MVKALIFDFDGTIADTLTMSVAAFNNAATQFNLPLITEDKLPILRDSGAKELFLKHFALSPIKLAKLIKKIQTTVKNQINEVKAIEGIPDLIHQLKKRDFKLGIVTSNSTENVELFLKNQNITAIDFIYSGKNLFNKNTIIDRAIKENDLDRQSTLYVGDEARDIEAAHQAGLKIIAVTWGFNSEKKLKEMKPEYLISKTSDLINII